MPFFVQCGYYLYGVVIFWTGGYFLCTGGYFLDRWLFFGQVVIFLVQVVIFLDRWLFFCTEGLCVYNAHSYFGYFAQMKYNGIYIHVVIIDQVVMQK